MTTQTLLPTPSAVAYDYLEDAIQAILHARSAILDLEQAYCGSPEYTYEGYQAYSEAFKLTNGRVHQLILAKHAIGKIHQAINPSDPRTWYAGKPANQPKSI